ncbi:MAG: hypothetical protein ACRERV_16470 [Methylococcales bacterium]
MSDYNSHIFQDGDSGLECRNPGVVDGFELAIRGHRVPGGMTSLRINPVQHSKG